MTTPANQDPAHSKRIRLGTELRLLRKLRRIGGREMARRINMSQSKLSRLERGEQLPSIDEIIAWANVLDMPHAEPKLVRLLTDAARCQVESRYGDLLEHAPQDDPGTTNAPAMTRPAARPLAEPLDIGVRQLHHRDQRIREIGITADDLALVADYLRELGEHGHSVAYLAEQAIDEAPREHPVLSTGEGCEVQVFLGHVGPLMEAAQSFASSCYGLLSKQDECPPE